MNYKITTFPAKTLRHQDVLPTLTEITIFATDIVVDCRGHTGIATISLDHQDLLPDLTKIIVSGIVNLVRI